MVLLVDDAAAGHVGDVPARDVLSDIDADTNEDGNGYNNLKCGVHSCSLSC